jgi:tripartite-type tricarboxylate transporter receptor subunit TctC
MRANKNGWMMKTAGLLPVAIASLCLGLGIGSSHVFAQSYPSRPVNLVVPFAPGGSIDIVGRLLGQQLAARLGQPFVIENRPGAGTVFATAAVAKAPADGHTLLITTSSLAINASLHKKLPYDSTMSFSPIALVAEIPLILVVNPALPVRSVHDLLALAKQKPGLSYASSGLGSALHLAAGLFKGMTGIEMTHVPYKSGPQAMNDVVAGHVPLMFADPGSAMPQIREGKVRALGVTSLVPMPSAPDIPPLARAVPAYDAVSWQIIVAPANTPTDIVSKLNRELNGVIGLAEVVQGMTGYGMIPARPRSPEELQRFTAAEIERWRTIVRRAGVEGAE